MDTVFVKPGRAVVRMPERDMRALPPEGAPVPLDQYWQARIRDGDAIVCAAPAEAISPAPPAEEQPATAPATKSPKKS